MSKSTRDKKKLESCSPCIKKAKKISKEKSKEPKKNNRSFLGKIIVKYDVGLSNNFYIRGSGAGLSWQQGVLMKNIGPDEWEWEPSAAFTECEFKVLINDQWYEAGDNHKFASGAIFQYTPFFP